MIENQEEEKCVWPKTPWPSLSTQNHAPHDCQPTIVNKLKPSMDLLQRQNVCEDGVWPKQLGWHAHSKIDGKCCFQSFILLRHSNTHTDRQTDRQTDNETDRQTDRQTDNQTDRQTDRQTLIDFMHIGWRRYIPEGTHQPRTTLAMALHAAPLHYAPSTNSDVSHGCKT